MNPPKTVNKGVRALAAEAGVDPALVSRKLKQGKTREQIIAEAQARRERIALTLSVDAVDKHVDAPESDEDFASAQRRKEIALADLREIEKAEKLGKLVESEATLAAWLDAIATSKTRLLMVPDDLGERIAPETNPIRCREMIAAGIRAALEDLAATA